MLSPFATGAIGVLFGIAEGVIWIIFIFVVGLYLLLDADRIGIWLDNLAPPDYRHEITLLRREIGAIWNSFFVGQMILCTIMGVTVGGATAILGIRSAFILGLVAAVAELVPNIGHTVSATVGITIAFLEGSYLPISNLWFALIVALVYIAITQLDINFLIPRIIGRRMHLSPAVVIMGLIAGLSIGGVLGLLLAAPTLSSLRVLGSYIYRRLLDLEPYVLVSGRQPASSPAPETGQEVKATNPPDTPPREAT
jgi:predicted PurR-regulated permease PerM